MNFLPTFCTLQECFVHSPYTGKYGLICSMHIPRGAGVVTVQFETFQHNADFMHLDFMPEGDVSIDDGNVRFGHFQNKNFYALFIDFITHPIFNLIGWLATIAGLIIAIYLLF